jgi:DeoR family glycerol-3-phosphate regulon repressor
VEVCDILVNFEVFDELKALKYCGKPQSQMAIHKVQSRQAKILEFLRHNGSQSIVQIATFLDVSDETIRRDATLLEREGAVVKHHGALALPSEMTEYSFQRRLREHVAERQAMARAALSLIHDGDSLVIDAGTTTFFFSKELRQRRNLTVITNSTDIAETLAAVPGNSIHLACGNFDLENHCTLGQAAISFVSRFHVKHAIVCPTSVNATSGYFDIRPEEADFAAAALNIADNRIMLADHSKFQGIGFARICEFSAVHTLVTDMVPQPSFIEPLKSSETQVIVAGQTVV